MITITGAAAEAVRSLVVLAEAEVVSEAEAVSVEAALAEEWAEAVVPVLVSKKKKKQIIKFNKNKKHEEVNYYHLSRCGYPCYMGSKCI
jgi:hypothetical protein